MVENDNQESIYSEDLIEKLEKIAKMVISAKEDRNVDFAFIEKMSFEYCINNDYHRVNEEKISLKKWEIIAYALKYYESIDRTLYEHIRDVLFNQKSNIKINVYNVDEVADFNEPDFEFNELNRYEHYPYNSIRSNKDIITIPLRRKKGLIQENYESTLSDLYTLIHEIAHTFDIDLGIIINKQSIIINRNYDLKQIFNESIARAFELNATTFFLNNGIIKDRKDASYILDYLNNDTLTKNYSVYIKLKLAKIYEEKGEITVEDLDEIFEPFNRFEPDEREKALEINAEDCNQDYFNFEHSLFIDMGYAISGMISPTIIEFLKNKKIKELKTFFELSRLGYFEKTLNALNISVDDKGIEVLIENMRKNGFNLGDSVGDNAENSKADETDIEK